MLCDNKNHITGIKQLTTNLKLSGFANVYVFEYSIAERSKKKVVIKSNNQDH